MARFEDLGYCPCNEIVHNQRSQWLQATDEEKGKRIALWNMIGAYLVCAKDEKISIVNEPGRIFFGTKTLANETLMALIRRYNFKKLRPIWIKREDSEIGEYVLSVSDRDPQVIMSTFDAGKTVVISNGDNDELIMAYWDISFDL